MKRHKRKQNQWSKKCTPDPLFPILATHYMLPSFPELAMLDRIREDPEITTMLLEATHANLD